MFTSNVEDFFVCANPILTEAVDPSSSTTAHQNIYTVKHKENVSGNLMTKTVWTKINQEVTQEVTKGSLPNTAPPCYSQYTKLYKNVSVLSV